MASKDNRTDFTEYYNPGLHDLLFRWIDFRKIYIIKKAFRNLKKSDLIVDIGSGVGNISYKLMTSKFQNVVCLDHDPKLLEVCKSKGLGIKKMDFDKKLPLKDSSVAGLMMIDAIEHVEDRHFVMKEIYRVLKPKGVAVLFTPPYDSVRWLFAEKFHNLITRRKSDHISPFTDESMTWLVSKYFKNYNVGRANFNLSMYAIVKK